MLRPSLLGLLTLLSVVSLAAGRAGAADAPKRVALVIDDGPHPAHNAPLLALLAREQVHVTFSHVGRNVVARPDLARAAADAGHEIINHSYTHPHLNAMADAEIAKEVSDTQEAVRQATGRAPGWFWAPFLEHDAHVDAVVRQAGLEHFPIGRYQLIGSKDWEAATTPEQFRRTCTTGITDGTVILMHEWPEVTLANLQAVIEELKRQGVVFLTFSELAKSGNAPVAAAK